MGAIIGTKGNHIKNIIKFSGASVKIAQANEPGAEDEAAGNAQSAQERKVTIVGAPESQWKAQYLVNKYFENVL